MASLSDSELADPQQRSRDLADSTGQDRRSRPASAPCRGEVQVLDLEMLTQECIKMFKLGREREALETGVAFAEMARQQLGRTHPTYINALATVAALADQMGCSEEAQALLKEAEGLHEEHEMETLERKLDDELADLSSDDDDPSTHSVDSDAELEIDASSCDSGQDADDDGLVGEGSDDEEAEAEAEALSRLTWEVNELIKQGEPQMAAQLLKDAEEVLADQARLDADGDEEGSSGSLRGMTKAALHALWAAVLESVGEKDRAAMLYSEALSCLKDDADDMGLGHILVATSEEDDDDSDEEGSEDEISNSGASSSDLARVAEEAKQREADAADAAAEAKRKADEERAREAAEAARIAEEEKAQEAAAAEAARKAEEAKAREAAAAAAAAEAARKAEEEKGRESAAAAAEATKKDSVPRAGAIADDARYAAEENQSNNQGPTADTKPKEPPPPPHAKQKRPSPIAPKSQAKQAAAPKASGPVRVGGGFAIPIPKAPPSAPGRKPPSVRRAKAKAAAKSISEPECPPQLSAATSPEPETQEEVEKPLEVLAITPEQERAAVLRAMSTADQFVGLQMFDRAADLLEAQLKRLAEETSPHHGSDLFVDVLSKYAGILWWDLDLEGAIDAYTAADEVLADRPNSEADPNVQRRRSQLQGKLAQIHRVCGHFDTADEKLSAAVECLQKLVESEKSQLVGQDIPQSTETTDSLRDMQAALGQVCVQKKEYERAEKFYMAAFAADEDGMNSQQDDLVASGSDTD